MEVFNMTDCEASLPTYPSNLTQLGVCCSPSQTAVNVMSSFLTISIALIAFTGNVAVVTASFWYETLRVQTGNLLVVYLSTIDILTAVIVMIPSAISVVSGYWPLGTKLCKIHAIFSYMFSCSSIINLAVISFDRAVAVLYPFEYRVRMTVEVMLKFCFFIFIVSFTIGMACGAPDWISYNDTEAVCAMDYTNSIGVFYVFNVSCFICFYIPSLIIGICNLSIIIAAHKSGKSVRTLFVRRKDVNSNLKESVQNEMHMKKTIKSLTVVVIIFFICYSPYALCKQVKVMLGMDMPPWFNYLSTIFIFIASATNPFIYAILRKDYRDAFKTLPKILKEKFSSF